MMSLQLTSPQRLADKAQISYTRFLRTTQREHHETVESVWVRPLLSLILIPC
jgi:methionyl-tRNA synthetase